VNPEFRIFLEPKCIVNPPPIPVKKKRAETPAIVALLLPKLIELAISGVATLLKKAGARTSRSTDIASPYRVDATPTRFGNFGSDRRTDFECYRLSSCVC